MELPRRVDIVTLFPNSIEVVKVLPTAVEKYMVDAVIVDAVIELPRSVENAIVRVFNVEIVAAEPINDDIDALPVIILDVVIVHPVAVENDNVSLCTDPDLESNTVIVDPVAVEKLRASTVITCEINSLLLMVHIFAVDITALLQLRLLPSAVENPKFSLFNTSDSELNTVIVHPDAVEKTRFLTLISLAVIELSCVCPDVTLRFLLIFIFCELRCRNDGAIIVIVLVASELIGLIVEILSEKSV